MGTNAPTGAFCDDLGAGSLRARSAIRGYARWPQSTSSVHCRDLTATESRGSRLRLLLIGLGLDGAARVLRDSDVIWFLRDAIVLALPSASRARSHTGRRPRRGASRSARRRCRYCHIGQPACVSSCSSRRAVELSRERAWHRVSLRPVRCAARTDMALRPEGPRARSRRFAGDRVLRHRDAASHALALRPCTARARYPRDRAASAPRSPLLVKALVVDARDLPRLCPATETRSWTPLESARSAPRRRSSFADHEARIPLVSASRIAGRAQGSSVDPHRFQRRDRGDGAEHVCFARSGVREVKDAQRREVDHLLDPSVRECSPRVLRREKSASITTSPTYIEAAPRDGSPRGCCRFALDAASVPGARAVHRRPPRSTRRLRSPEVPS